MQIKSNPAFILTGFTRTAIIVCAGPFFLAGCGVWRRPANSLDRLKKDGLEASANAIVSEHELIDVPVPVGVSMYRIRDVNEQERIKEQLFAFHSQALPVSIAYFYKTHMRRFGWKIIFSSIMNDPAQYFLFEKPTRVCFVSIRNTGLVTLLLQERPSPNLNF